MNVKVHPLAGITHTKTPPYRLPFIGTRESPSPFHIQSHSMTRLHLPPFLRLIAPIALSLAFISTAWSAPQDLRHFDDFIHHVRQEAGSGDATRIMDCFSLMVVNEEGCVAVPIADILGEEAQRFGWKAIGSDVARFADGFVLIDTDGTMMNLQARAVGKNQLLEITGNRVKLRREAGDNGEVIALLDAGVLHGATDPARWVVTRDGMEWTPVWAEIEGIGKVRGYIGSDYVRSAKGHGDIKLTASYDGNRWALTGYERSRTDLKVTCSHPMP